VGLNKDLYTKENNINQFGPIQRYSIDMSATLADPNVENYDDWTHETVYQCIGAHQFFIDPSLADKERMRAIN
jgi:hypothetical protein